MNELRPCGSEQQHRTADVVQRIFEELEEYVLGPVQILDQQDGRLLGRELVEERDPRQAQPLARVERVDVRGCFQPERHPEDGVLPEPAPHGLRGIALGQAEMLANDLAQRHVRDPRTVREAASDSPQRLGRL